MSDASEGLTLADVLEDMAVRFVLNLPSGEVLTTDRLFFQLQQAHWHYEDFYADRYEHLPHMRGREFMKRIFESCPALAKYRDVFGSLFASFRQYLSVIPTYGMILLDSSLENVLVVQSFSNSYGFPKGKVNEGESGAQCAAREVFEETGYDATAILKEKDSFTAELGPSTLTLYVAVGAPMGYAYAPQVRKEVKRVLWVPVADLLKKSDSRKYWNLRPFIHKLTRWIKRRKKTGAGASAAAAGGKKQKGGKKAKDPRKAQGTASDYGSESGGGGGGGKSRARKAKNKKPSDPLGDALGTKGSWSVEDMFRANARLTGREFTYDGNPQDFGSKNDDSPSLKPAAAPSDPQPQDQAFFDGTTFRFDRSRIMAALAI